MPEVIVINPIEQISNHKKRVAAYARVSSDSEDQKHSFAAQLDYYTNLISENNEWEFVNIYADGGVIIGLS